MSDVAQVYVLKRSFDDENEKLYRAVYPARRVPRFWKNGKLTSAAFKDPKGLSVERQDGRTDDELLTYVKKEFTGNIVSVTVSHCNGVNACIKHKPSKRSNSHCEIHKNDLEVLLDDVQAKRLARLATVEYREEE